MKKYPIIPLSILCLMLSACLTDGHLQDISNNNFVGLSAQKPPHHAVGVWTGSMTAWLVTFVIQENGEGYYCYSSSTKDGIQKTKFSDGNLIVQDGSRFVLQSANPETITLQAPYYGVKSHVLYKDANLKEASVYCQNKL